MLPLVPAVRSFAPIQGGIGSVVVLTGAAFIGTTSVLFGGTPARSFTVINDSTLRAVVASSTTRGSISVTNANGTGVSGSFFDIALPTLGWGSLTTLESGATVTDLAVGDLQRDGAIDVIAAQSDGPHVAVILNHTDGGFAPLSEVPVAAVPFGVVVLDQGRSSGLDLAACEANSNAIDLLQSTGSGYLDASLVTGNTPVSVAVGDFNADGIPDLVTADETVSAVSILLGRPDGGFATPTGASVLSNPQFVTTGDLNADGVSDIATADPGTNSVSVLLGAGGGSFEAFSTVTVGNGPKSVTLGDVDGDGLLDVVTPNSGDATVSVALGHGTGTFFAAQAFRVGTYPNSVAIADVNGDGLPDLVVANSQASALSLLLGFGDGGFGRAISIPGGTNPNSVAVADFNNDGHPDLVTTNGDDTITVLFGFGAAPALKSFLPTTGGVGSTLLITGSGFSNHTATVTIGGTPVASFVVESDTRILATVATGTGSGTLSVSTAGGTAISTAAFTLVRPTSSWAPAVRYAAGNSPFGIAIADVSGDGIPDVSVTNSADGTIDVFSGLGDGGFGMPFTLTVGGTPYGIAAAILSSSGLIDLVCADNLDDNLVEALNRSVVGNLGFDPSSYLVDSDPYSVAIADFNGDGVLDAVTSDVGGGDVSVLLGLGDGGFGSSVGYGVAGGPFGVAIGDLNADGIPDLVTCNEINDSLSVLFGIGDGTFALEVNTTTGIASDAIALGDANGDGLPDVATADYSANTVSVLLGQTDAGFGPPASISVGANPTSVVFTDVNGDGVPDLVASNFGYADGGTISIVLGFPDAGFGTALALPVGLGPQTIAVADLNGDGCPDLITANFDDHSISVLLGQP